MLAGKVLRFSRHNNPSELETGTLGNYIQIPFFYWGPKILPSQTHQTPFFLYSSSLEPCQLSNKLLPLEVSKLFALKSKERLSTQDAMVEVKIWITTVQNFHHLTTKGKKKFTSQAYKREQRGRHSIMLYVLRCHLDVKHRI